MKFASTRSSLRIVALVSLAILTFRGAALRAGDCNSNGTDDLLDLESGASRDCNANLVPDECELAAGAVAYEARLTFHTGFASSIVAEDFDGDGDLDMVAAEFYAPGQETSPQQDRAVVFLRNLGGGGFGLPERYEVSEKPYRVQAADFDGDADLDLFVIFSEAVQMGVFINRGDGTFEGPELHGVRGSWMGPKKRGSIADLDGDGDRDIAVTALEPGQVSFFLNRGDGSFTAGTSLLLEGAHALELEDLDGDADIDIALHTLSEPDNLAASFIVLLNDGTGAFPDRFDHDLGAYPGAAALADLDGDGDLDYLVARDPPRDSGLPQDVAAFRNRGDGRFDPAPSLPSFFRTEVIHVVDVDLDGDGDVLLASDGQIHRERDSVTIFLNDGTGAFSPPARHVVGDHPTQVEAVDVNGDARPEVLVLNYFGGSLSVLRNAGGGAFDGAVDFPILGGPGPYMACADLDADGDVDVATASFSNDQSIGILENITGGEFTQGCREFLRGDVNADGALSLADIIMLRRFLFEGSILPTCFDAADTTDNDEVNLCDAVTILDRLFRNPGWQDTLPAPSPEAGDDPTSLAEPSHPCDVPGGVRPSRPLGCMSYQVEPPAASDDVLRIGAAVGIPGELAKIPVHLTASVPVDAIQIVLSYDPAVLEPDSEGGISFESTYLERFEQPFGILSAQPEHGVLVAGIAGNLILPGFAVEPGDDILVGWINIRVKPDAALGEVSLEPTNGPDGLGMGPYRLRNEITHKGAARLVTFIPRTVGARLGIVGDQSLFIRGDADGDRKLDISDPVVSLASLFLGAAQLECKDSADSNDDGMLDIADPVFTLSYLFQGTRSPPAPFPALGIDPTVDSLECFP